MKFRLRPDRPGAISCEGKSKKIEIVSVYLKTIVFSMKRWVFLLALLVSLSCGKEDPPYENPMDKNAEEILCNKLGPGFEMEDHAILSGMPAMLSGMKVCYSAVGWKNGEIRLAIPVPMPTLSATISIWNGKARDTAVIPSGS